jgi:predicted nucleotidyltransferase component of viral defense system
VISKEEVLERARVFSLEPSVVEKDYVLGWLLHAIGNHAELAEKWVFKGGTCLKKIHFETYRFSEDLDFTLQDPSQLNPAFLKDAFEGIAAVLYEEVGLEIPVDRLRFDLRTNPRGHPAVEGRIYYRGPLGLPSSAMPRVKLDLTSDEQLVEPPELLQLALDYSDRPQGGTRILCYGLVEIFAEKTRALGDRGRARDLYDVVHLFRRPEAKGRAIDVLRVLRAKCAYKDLPEPTIEAMGRERETIAAQWEAMLSHQLPELPPFEAFWNELADFFIWLYTPERVSVPGAYELAAGEAVLHPPVGGVIAGLGARPLQTICFAAANHLCVDLSYEGDIRRIEPYSLRETRAGNIVLHAHRADTGEHRSYRVDRIEGAASTTQTFTPRWTIELSPRGYQAIPPTVGRAGIPRPRARSQNGPVHIYECNTCGKHFRRKRRDSGLRAHMDPSGLPCPSRSAHLLETQY